MGQLFTSIANPNKILDSFEKGKKASIGEIRTWNNGQKMQKTIQGWVAIQDENRGKSFNESLEYKEYKDALDAWDKMKPDFQPDTKKTKYENDKAREHYNLYVWPKFVATAENKIGATLKKFPKEELNKIKNNAEKENSEIRTKYPKQPDYLLSLVLPKELKDKYFKNKVLLKQIQLNSK